MIRIFVLLLNDIKLFFTDWKAVVLLIILPVFAIGFFSYALAPYINSSNFIEPFDIAIVDMEDTAQSRMIIGQLEQISVFRRIIKEDYDGAVDLIKNDKVGSALVIPEEFTLSVSEGRNKPVTVIGNKKKPIQSYIVKNLMLSAANLISAGQSAIAAIYHFNREAGAKGSELNAQYADSTSKIMLQTLARNEVFTQADAGGSYDLTPAEYYTAGLIAIFLMLAGMPGMKMLVTERTMGMTLRLKASPVRMWQVILSKFLVSMILSLVQFGAIIIMTSAVFKNYWGAPPYRILMLFGGILFAVSAWSVFVSSISRTPATADAVGYLGILLMAVVGGSIYPLPLMPGFIRSISVVTINRWAMEGFMQLFSGESAIGAVPGFFPLVVIGVILLACALIRMRYMAVK